MSPIMTPAGRGGAEVTDRRPPTLSTRGGGGRRTGNSSPALAPRDAISSKKRQHGFTEGPTVKGAFSILVLSVEKSGNFSWGWGWSFYSFSSLLSPLALAGIYFSFLSRIRIKKLGKRWFSTKEKEKETHNFLYNFASVFPI